MREAPHLLLRVKGGKAHADGPRLKAAAASVRLRRAVQPGADGNTRREDTKNRLSELERADRGLKQRIFNAFFVRELEKEAQLKNSGKEPQNG